MRWCWRAWTHNVKRDGLKLRYKFRNCSLKAFHHFILRLSWVWHQFSTFWHFWPPPLDPLESYSFCPAIRSVNHCVLFIIVSINYLLICVDLWCIYSHWNGLWAIPASHVTVVTPRARSMCSLFPWVFFFLFFNSTSPVPCCCLIIHRSTVPFTSVARRRLAIVLHCIFAPRVDTMTTCRHDVILQA